MNGKKLYLARRRLYSKVMFGNWKHKNEDEQSEVEECTDIVYRKEDAMAQRIKAVNKCVVAAERNIVEECCLYLMNSNFSNNFTCI